MKYAVLILAAAPVFAQISARPTPAAAPAPTKPVAMPVSAQPRANVTKIPLRAFVELERGFDQQLQDMRNADAAGPIDLLGATRGIYLDGYGVVFTTEMGLIQTPTVNPFNRTITEEQKARVHSAKVTRLAAIRKAVQDMAQRVATSMGQVPDSQLVVVAVRLDYAPWENTSGLPGLITAKADRLSASRGQIQLEEQ